MNRKRYFQELSKEAKNPVGKLSAELRKALQLENDMLPFWIYRMRILGYPPSWMAAAQLSTLKVHTSGNHDNPFAEEMSEDGELKSLQYNKDSLIEFPGFNTPVPDNVKDDWIILGMPPYQKGQQLTEAVKTMRLTEPVPYKKARLESDDVQNSPSTSSSSSRLDISVEANTETVEEPENAKETNNEISQLNECSNSSNDTKKSDSNSSNTERKMKVISTGTPVPSSFHTGLPPLENFSIGMGELLYFENLPNYTGTYQDKMKGLLDKIRHRHDKN